MSDRIEGVALLQSGAAGGPEMLTFTCVRANSDRKPWRDHILVRPAGTPEIPGRTTWEYTVAGEFLDVHPSVKITTNTGPGTPEIETFHNEGQWRVRFERFTPLPDLVWENGIGDHGQRARFHALNPTVEIY